MKEKGRGALPPTPLSSSHLPLGVGHVHSCEEGDVVHGRRLNLNIKVRGSIREVGDVSLDCGGEAGNTAVGGVDRNRGLAPVKVEHGSGAGVEAVNAVKVLAETSLDRDTLLLCREFNFLDLYTENITPFEGSFGARLAAGGVLRGERLTARGLRGSGELVRGEERLLEEVINIFHEAHGG